MDIFNVKIGDTVISDNTACSMKVVGILYGKYLQLTPNIEGYCGDVWVEDASNVQLIDCKYVLPNWVRESSFSTFVSTVKTEVFDISYTIEESNGCYILSLTTTYPGTICDKRICTCESIAKAKAEANKHYNEFATRLIETISNPQATKFKYNMSENKVCII